MWQTDESTDSDSEQVEESDSPEQSEPKLEPEADSGGNRRYPSHARCPSNLFGYY